MDCRLGAHSVQNVVVPTVCNLEVIFGATGSIAPTGCSSAARAITGGITGIASAKEVEEPANERPQEDRPEKG